MQQPLTPSGGVPVSAPPASPETLAALRRRRRWRTWGLLLAVSLGWKLIVLTLGAAVPRWLIDDGIAELPAASQAYGSEAKAIATALWSHPLERHGLVRRVRVVSVDGAAEPGATRRATPAPTRADGAAASGPVEGQGASGVPDSADVATPAAADSGEEGAPCARHARVRAYTYFAIPYSEVRTSCGSGVVEYRVLRRWRPRG